MTRAKLKRKIRNPASSIRLFTQIYNYNNNKIDI